MAGPLPGVPNNFLVQTGNGTTYLSWSPVVSSSGYNIYRSEDSVNYSPIGASSTFYFYDPSANVGTQYFYKLQSFNGNGVSGFTSPITIVPVNPGQVSLGQLRFAAQQRADMVNNNFITTQEWNSYINNSWTELYDLLVAVYADEYFVTTPFSFTLDNRVPSLYPLPDDFYKLMGLDLSLNSTQNAWLSIKKFQFTNRNKYLYGTTPVTYYGFVNIEYRIVGANIEFIPQPSANGQTIRIWYVPKPQVLLADQDILDGVSGWWEYIIIDAAIKALNKEESDVTVLMARKEEMKKRIEAMAANRDQGLPETVTDVRSMSGFWDTWGNGPSGGGW